MIANRDETYFVTSVPDPDWNIESWSARGEMDEVFKAMAGFHEEVHAVLRACPEEHKWALFERDPLPLWRDGPIALLGDACHPMTPYMAQGAANALEDAAVLARCLGQTQDVAAAFAVYETARHPRTSRVQLTSRQNAWGKAAGDTSWRPGGRGTRRGGAGAGQRGRAVGAVVVCCWVGNRTAALCRRRQCGGIAPSSSVARGHGWLTTDSSDSRAESNRSFVALVGRPRAIGATRRCIARGSGRFGRTGRRSACRSARRSRRCLPIPARFGNTT